MNVENYTGEPCSLSEVFARQKELKFAFEPDAKELFENFDIDVYEDQEQFKRYCWRITEELCEANEALISGEWKHFLEEIIDGFNFLVELIMLYGWGPSDVTGLPEDVKEPESVKSKDLRDDIFTIIYSLGLTANLLKNRQWRQSQHLTDLFVFERRLKGSWLNYMLLFERCGLGPREITKLYDRKNKVNKFRINTNY